MKAMATFVFQREALTSLLLPGSLRRFGDIEHAADAASVVMAPVLWAARTFPEAELQAERLTDGQWEAEPGHDLAALLRRPNPHYSGRALWMSVLADVLVSGNGYAILREDVSGTVREAWWAPSTVMKPRGTEAEFITHYEYSPNGLPVRIEAKDVVHLRYGLDPDNQRLGRSPLSSVLREVLTDTEADNFTSALLQNMGVPGIVVSPEPGQAAPSDADAAATKTYLRDNFTGDKRGTPLVMSGATRIQQFGFSPEQLNLRALRRVPEERVTAVLGIPAIVAGLGAGLDRSTFANMAEAREMAYENCIIPLQGLVAEQLAMQLLWRFESNPDAVRLRFDVSHVRVLQEDETKKAERMARLVTAGIVTRAEARRATGFDADETDEVYHLPINVQPVPQGAPIEPPRQDGPIEPIGTSARGIKGRDAAGLALFNAERRSLLALEPRLADDLEAAFRSLGRLAADAYLAVSPAKDAADAALVERVLHDLDLRQWSDMNIKEPMERHYVRTGEASVDNVNQTFDLGVSFDEPAERAMLNAGGTRAGLLDVTEDTRAALLRSIEAGREAGLGPPDIARTIRSEVPAGRFTNAGPKYRAELIARAETKTAQNVACRNAYRTAGVEVLLAFDARIGDDHDPACEQRDGQEYGIAEAESEDLTHPNCSLSWAPVIP